MSWCLVLGSWVGGLGLLVSLCLPLACLFCIQVYMEYCDQGTLVTLIQKGMFQASSGWNARLALRALLRTAREVCQGMSHLHAHGVIHGEYVPMSRVL